MISRRGLLMAFVGIPITAPHVTAESRSGVGFIVSGHVTATDTDRAEGFVALGQDVALIVRDQATYDRDIAPLIGKVCELTLWEQR